MSRSGFRFSNLGQIQKVCLLRQIQREDHIVGNLLFFYVSDSCLDNLNFMVTSGECHCNVGSVGTFCWISRLAISNWFCEGSRVQVCERFGLHSGVCIEYVLVCFCVVHFMLFSHMIHIALLYIFVVQWIVFR